MPNGHSDSNSTYNKEWCDERHSRQDKALEDLTKTLGEIKTDLASIKAKLDERDKGSSMIVKLLPLLLAALLGSGGGAAVTRALSPDNAPTAQAAEHQPTQP